MAKKTAPVDREAAAAIAPETIKPQELAMAASLVDNLSMDFEPDKYHDDYREALLAHLSLSAVAPAFWMKSRRFGAAGPGVCWVMFNS